MANDPSISSSVPRLSASTLHELRRIYTKHLLEVFASPEAVELHERGCITGRFAEASEPQSKGMLVIEEVTPLGVATLRAHEN